jgi:serine/threonine protein kinase
MKVRRKAIRSEAERTAYDKARHAVAAVGQGLPLEEVSLTRKLCQVAKLRLRCDEKKLQHNFAPYQLGRCLTDDADSMTALVYEAVDTSSGREVAVKVPNLLSTGELVPTPLEDKVEALRDEAKVLARFVGTPHIVTLVADWTERRLPFLVLERLGGSLLEVIDREESLCLKDALEVLRDVARGLAAMHGKGYCHNDVKPGNVLRGPQGWTLIDPTTPDWSTTDYTYSDALEGAPRDIFALGLTFLAAYLGEEREKEEQEIPDGCDLEDEPDVVRLLNRMLGKTHYGLPDAKWVRRRAEQLLADPRGPG